METRSDDSFLGRNVRGYYLEELLEQRELAMIYRAHTEELWQVPDLIITILLVPDTLSSYARSQFTERFYAQGKKLASLRHPHLYPLYGYGEQEGFFYLLSPPLAQKETLTRYIERNGPRSAEEVLSILLPLVSVVDYLHSQAVAYPFLSPDDILLFSDQTILLSGLDLALLLTMQALPTVQAERRTYGHLKAISGSFLGMPEYLAPEVVRGAEASSNSTIYALGVLLFQLLGGSAPLQGEDYRGRVQKHLSQPLPSLHDLSASLPVALDIIVNRATHYNMHYRFKTARELADAYATIVNAHLDTPRPGSLIQAIQQVRALPAPTETHEMEVAEAHEEARVEAGKKSGEAQEEAGVAETEREREKLLAEDTFLLEGEDSLFLGEEEKPDALLVTSKKHAIVTRPDIPAASLVPPSQKREEAENPLSAMLARQKPLDQVDQTTHARIGTMASQFHQLKARLQAQAQAMAESPYTSPEKTDQ